MAELNFDSRVNYQKIYLQDTVALSVADPNSTAAATITHPLGYIPNVRVWFTNGGGNISTAVTDAAGSNLYPLTSDYTHYACHYTVTSSALTITLVRGTTSGTTINSTIYYRIYFDGN